VLDKGTYLYNNADKFGISGREHHLFWESENGRNNYLERFDRYERFCKKALEMGIPETSGVLSVKPDKWFLLGEYHKYKREYSKAVECFERSLRDESNNIFTKSLLDECKQNMNAAE